MKKPFVHWAELILDPGADSAAPGGAVTLALCGSWNHEGACRWPHHSRFTSAERRGELRVVFVAESGEEIVVRHMIDQALTNGRCTGPDGTTSQWALVASSAGDLTTEERKWSAQIVLPCPER